MGIGTDGAKDLITAIKAGTTTKQALRFEIGEAINILNLKASAIDVQLSGAAAEFAAANPEEFEAHVASLPDVEDQP